MKVITPNGARVLRKRLRQCFADAHRLIAEARSLRASAKNYLDREDAATRVLHASWAWDDARRCIRELNSSRVEKWAAVSPAARDRLISRQS